MKNQKGLAHILFIFVTLVGIVATVFLASKTQIFKPKATGEEVKLTENQCVKKDVSGNKYLVCPDVVLFLTSPLETGKASPLTDSSFSLVKPAFAQEIKGGVGYTCEKEGGDKAKIYHQQCNFRLLGIDFCKLNFPGTKYDLITESCDIGQRCDETTTDLFNTIAKCVQDDSPIVRNLNPIVTQPGIGNRQTPSPTSSTRTTTPVSRPPTPLPVASQIPQNSQNPTPTPIVTVGGPRATANPTVEPVATVNPAATNRLVASPTSSPEPTIGTTPSLSPSPSASAAIQARTTKGYRIVEELADLSNAQLTNTGWIDNYQAGGMPVEYSIKSKTYGKKTLFVQFRDQDNKIINFKDSGRNYTSIEINFPDPAAKTSAASAKPSASATARPTTAPTVRPAAAQPTAATAGINCPDLASTMYENQYFIDNCTITQLSHMSNARLMQFPASLLVKFPNERLVLFSNDQLILIADNSIGRQAFFSKFSCTFLSTFSLEIQQLVNCVSSSGGGTTTTPSADSPANNTAPVSNEDYSQGIAD